MLTAICLLVVYFDYFVDLLSVVVGFYDLICRVLFGCFNGRFCLVDFVACLTVWLVYCVLLVFW